MIVFFLLFLLFPNPCQAKLSQLNGSPLRWTTPSFSFNGQKRDDSSHPPLYVAEIPANSRRADPSEHHGFVSRDPTSGAVYVLANYGSPAFRSATHVAPFEPAHKRFEEGGDVLRHTHSFRHSSSNTKRVALKLSTSRNLTRSWLHSHGVVGVYKRVKPRKVTFPFVVNDVYAQTTPVDVPATFTQCIIDTGVDGTHCAFYDSLHPIPFITLSGQPVPDAIPDTGHRKIRGYAYGCDDNSASCPSSGFTDFSDGHGTHVCGIALGQPCLEQRGVAPNARLIMISIATSQDDGSLQLPVSLQGAFETCRSNGGRVVSASWGAGCTGQYDYVCEQFDEAAVLHPDLFFQIAAGNCGRNAFPSNGMSSPATAKNVVSVAAAFMQALVYETSQTPPRGFASTHTTYASMADFSSLGPTPDGRYPLLAAPGVGVVSADAHPNEVPNHAEYVAFSGTSMATPALPSLGVMAKFNVTRASDVSALMLLFSEPGSNVVSFSTGQMVAGSTEATARSLFGAISLNTSDSSAGVRQLVLNTTGSFTSFFSVVDPIVWFSLVWTDAPSMPLAVPDGTSLLINLAHLYATFYDSSGSALGGAAELNIVSNFKRLVIVPPPLCETVRVVAFAPFAFAGTDSVVSLGARGVAATSERPACSPYEPVSSCSVTQGTGLLVCNHTQPACLPQSCGAGFQFSGAQCVAGPGLNQCPSLTAFDGTGCSCFSVSICADGTAVNNCDSQQVAICLATWTHQPFPDAATPPPPSSGPPRTFGAAVQSITSEYPVLAWLALALFVVVHPLWIWRTWALSTEVWTWVFLSCECLLGVAVLSLCVWGGASGVYAVWPMYALWVVGVSLFILLLPSRVVDAYLGSLLALVVQVGMGAYDPPSTYSTLGSVLVVGVSVVRGFDDPWMVLVVVGLVVGAVFLSLVVSTNSTVLLVLGILFIVACAFLFLNVVLSRDQDFDFFNTCRLAKEQVDGEGEVDEKQG